MRQQFYVVREKISVGYDKRHTISPLTSIVKITHFDNVYKHDVAKVSDIYKVNSHFLYDPIEKLFLST